jgi:site-specific DNA-methyltransferase (adenine-specific)
MDNAPNLDHIAADLRPLAVPMSTLRRDPENARVGHDLPGIAFSLHKFGQRVPLVVNRSQDNKIEKGNGTYQAAESLKWEYIAAVFVEDNPDAATGFALADNRLAGKSRFDEEALARLLQEIRPQLVPGFSDDEARALVARVKGEHTAATSNGTAAKSAAPSSPAVVTAAEEEPAVPEPVLGQLYEFESKSTPGRRHRLLIGDSADPAVIALVRHGELFTGVFTSPPYADQRSDHYGGVAAEDYLEWFSSIQDNVFNHLAADGSFFLNIRPHAEDGELNLYVYELVLKMREWGWRLIDELCWVRQGFPGRFTNRFKNAHEPVFHFALQTAVKFRPENVIKESRLDYATTYQERGMNGNATMGSGYDGKTGRNVKAADSAGSLPSNVIRALTGAHSPGIRYGATFPLDLPLFFLQAYSDPGDTWLDPFGGSGTTMEAAEKCGRVACLVDINPTAALKTFERMALLGIRPRLVQEA